MYSRIMVPVDLAHADKLDKALDIAARLAKAEGATLIYTGVGTTAPSTVAHNPEEYARKLETFAKEQGDARGLAAESHSMRAHDVSVELADLLIRASEDVQADLVVMASHVPGVADHVFHSNAGHVAAHAPVSVFVVR